MRTFVVLYVLIGLDEPLYVSSVILGVIAASYVAAAAASARFGDRSGLGNVILGASVVYGVGLLVGPLAVGAAIDLFDGVFASTDGYAVVWPAVAIPVLAVIPLVALLAETERIRDTDPRPAG